MIKLKIFCLICDGEEDKEEMVIVDRHSRQFKGTNIYYLCQGCQHTIKINIDAEEDY